MTRPRHPLDGHGPGEWHEADDPELREKIEAALRDGLGIANENWASWTTNAVVARTMGKIMAVLKAKETVR
jgi:hypothetical protein